MTYSSTFDEDDFKLRKNCPDMRSRIVDMVDDICRDPYRGTRLVGTNMYRERVGRCRISYAIDERAHRVDFVDIGPRGGFYKAG